MPSNKSHDYPIPKMGSQTQLSVELNFPENKSNLGHTKCHLKGKRESESSWQVN